MQDSLRWLNEIIWLLLAFGCLSLAIYEGLTGGATRAAATFAGLSLAAFGYYRLRRWQRLRRAK